MSVTVSSDPTSVRAASPLPPVTFVLGGARSGKSRYAEGLVESVAGDLLYIATAEARDEEMARRIAIHRERRGPRWRTLEAPDSLPEDLGAVLGGAEHAAIGGILVDCLSLWLTNLMLAEQDIERASSALLNQLAEPSCPVVLVANEVGLGIVPETPLGRHFRDAAGLLNQRVAALAGRVVFIAAGLPLVLKETQD